MRRTLNEIHRMCQKAAEGAGAPPGVDTDAADGAVWLAARGLDPLGGLAAALEGMDGQAGNGGLAAAGDTLDAAGKPGALIAPALVDLLASAAMADGRTARLRTVGLSAPLFLLPGATRYAEDGWGFRFTAADAEDRRFVLIVAPGTGVAITASAEVASIGAALGNCVPFDVDMVCARDTDASTGEFETEGWVLADAALLAAAEARSVADGVMVAPEPWHRLAAFAGKVLVPATEESRRRGAG